MIAIAGIAIVYTKWVNKSPQSSVADNIKQKQNETKGEAAKQQTEEVPRTGAFNPGLIISKGVSSKPKSLPDVEQMGEITIEELNKYTCNNERRLLSLFGTVFDVTHAVEKYGEEL